MSHRHHRDRCCGEESSRCMNVYVMPASDPDPPVFRPGFGGERFFRPEFREREFFRPEFREREREEREEREFRPFFR